MLVTLAFAFVTSACPSDPYGSARLRANRDATISAGTTRSGTLVAHYSLASEGLTGKQDFLTDLSEGRFISSFTLGTTSGAAGFDGTDAWQRDISGFHIRERGGDKHALAVNEAYRTANLWWRPNRGGARVDVVDCSALRITPRDGKPFEAWFSANGDLTRVRETRSWNTTVETAYSKWRAGPAGRIAGHIESITNDDESTREVRDLVDSSITGVRPASAFARPANPKLQAATLGGADRATLPFRLMNNHIVVDARVNGSEPRPFIVDTGGHVIVTPSKAKALGIRVEGSSSSGGSGEKTVTSGYARVASIEAGGAQLRDAIVFVLDFSPRDVEGFEVGGMIGSEFLERFVVEMDYGAHTLTLIDPQRFGAAERQRAGTAMPLNFYDHMPQVVGMFEGLPARFNIDTGSRSDVSVTSPFVARASLRDRFPDGTTITDGWGVGGPAHSYVVRATHMKLGPVDAGRPIAGLSTAKRGVMADENFEGNVGSGLLKRFVVTFDYGREMLYLRPLAHPEPDTGRFDRSGLWINMAEHGVEVMDVAEGGPGAAAGIRSGDVITRIGAQAVADMTLSDTRRLLKLLPDAPVQIEFRRGAADQVTTLKPRNLIPD